MVPTLVGHGMERMAILASQVLSDHYNVSIIVFSKNKNFYSTTCPIYSLELPAARGKLSKMSNLIMRIFKFRRLQTKFQFYHVISFGTSANFVNVLSRIIGANHRSIISFRGFATISRSLSFRISCLLADSIFCISQEMKYELLKIFPKGIRKTHVVYNAIDTEDIQKQKRKIINFNPSHPAYVAIGRLEKVKGYIHLIKAFALVKDKYPSASLTFIGEGSDKQSLISLSEELNIKESINFLGSLKNPFAYISKCDICTQTSITEGFMNVLIEAGACNIPVISTACKTGPKEILTGEFIPEQIINDNFEIVHNGILSPSFTYDDQNSNIKEAIYSKAMQLLWQDNSLRRKLAGNIRERANDFSLNEYKKNLLSVLDKSLQK